MGKSNETQVLSNAERQARFKANKAFKSLPPDVQRSIEAMSGSPEEKAQRTAIALDYQVKMGKRLSTGMDCRIPKNSAKPGDEEYQQHTGPDEHCSECSSILPRLEQQRQYPGTCSACVTGKVAV